MVASLTQFLASGLYTVAEAATYAQVDPRLASRWFFDGHGPTLRTEVPAAKDERWLTFLDFIQLLAVRSIRQQKNVPLKAIREVVSYAETTHGITYPFARKHTIYVLDPQKSRQSRNQRDASEDLKSPRLVLRVVDAEGVEQWIEAAGKHRGQPNIPPIIESYLDDIGYDAGGLAQQYTALRSDGVEIEMVRGVAFGVPKLKDHRVTVWDVWETVRSEGSIPAAAAALDLKDIEVRVACRYVQSIKRAA